jgi:hypothetical protein
MVAAVVWDHAPKGPAGSSPVAPIIIEQNMPNKRMTTEQFISKARLVHGNYYDYSKSIYTLRVKKICIVCPVHGDFWQRPANHLRGTACAKCAFDKNLKVKDTNWFLDKAKKVHGDKFDYSLSVYKGCGKKIKIYCKKCKKFFFRSGTSHLTGKGCYFCHFKVTNISKFLSKAIKIHGDYYGYSKTIYKASQEKVIITCPKHGDFLQKPANHLRGIGCPTCKLSKGERAVRIWLQQHDIKFIQQFWFKDCRIKKPLRFDFYLPDYTVCIEYDGPQHEKALRYIGKKVLTTTQAEKIFEHMAISDGVKTQYCISHKIKLIRIKHDENIEENLNCWLGGLSD